MVYQMPEKKKDKYKNTIDINIEFRQSNFENIG